MQSGEPGQKRLKDATTDGVTATSTTKAPRRSAQVVIIGAGLAGLAAAQRLYESGVSDVVVLEAQERVGGRVHTINHSDYLLEMGAQWLHGADQNPLYKWLTELSMLDDFEDASLGFKGLFCTEDGREADARLVAKVLEIVCESKLLLSKNRYVDIITNKGLRNAGQVFRHQLDARLNGDEELLHNKSLVYAIFDWFLRYETIENCCDSMDEVSTASYTDWTDWGDGTLLNFKQGYRSLLQWFCGQFPASRWVHLNKRVVSVELADKHSATNTPNWGPNTETSTGAGADRRAAPVVVRYVDTRKPDLAGLVECNHVIVTVSLGFLKRNHATFFRPQLPKAKRELIESVGFGTVNKIVLQFEAPFWHQGGIKLVWKDASGGPDKHQLPEWTRDIIAFDVVRRQPNLLIGWIGGAGARQVELESDEFIGHVCLRLFDKFLPKHHCRPTKLLSCICSRWHSNPFTCGSYSFQSMGSFDLNVDKLNEPLYSDNSDSPVMGANKFGSCSASRVPQVLFAGEATAGKLYSTTHGAVISGWREADRLADHLCAGNKANIQTIQTIDTGASGPLTTRLGAS